MTVSRNALSCSLRPGLHLARAVALLARWVGGVEWVARDVPPPDGVLAGLVQAGVHVVDGHRREAVLAVLGARLGELRVEGVDLAAGELGELHASRCAARCGTRRAARRSCRSRGGSSPSRPAATPWSGTAARWPCWAPCSCAPRRRPAACSSPAWHSFCVAKPALVSRRRSSVSCRAPPHFGQLSRGRRSIQNRLLQTRAALRRRQADVDDVLPAAGALLTAVTDVSLSWLLLLSAAAWVLHGAEARIWRRARQRDLPPASMEGQKR